MTLLKRWLRAVARNTPYLNRVFLERDQLRAERAQLHAERDQLRAESDQLRAESEQLRAEADHLRQERDQYMTWVPPGHFYSPIPSLEEIRQQEDKIFPDTAGDIPAVDLNVDEQLALLDELKQYYEEQPFSTEKQPHLRYFLKNPYYSYADGIFLYCMIRHLRPERIVEVGSGYSSCAILDTNELFFDNRIRCTFIDPHPQSLLELLQGSDSDRAEIIPEKVQDVDDDRFLELAPGDILSIDSTHVAKTGSDVNSIFFRILPRLRSGVYVHFHDVFYPFEYPKDWVYEGRAWNEAYLLRAFLQHNECFKIVLFSDYLLRFHREKLADEMPLCVKGPPGSIWIRKV